MTDREKKIMKTRMTPHEYELVKNECERNNISIQKFIKILLKCYFTVPQLGTAVRTVPQLGTAVRDRIKKNADPQE